MFDFLKRSGVEAPSQDIRRTLELQGLPPDTDMAAVRVVESRGRYSDRKVTFVRVFSTVQTAAAGVPVHGFHDLDAHPNLVLRAGHVEQDGTLVLATPASTVTPPTPSRERADRAAHADDEAFVSQSTDRA